MTDRIKHTNIERWGVPMLTPGKSPSGRWIYAPVDDGAPRYNVISRHGRHNYTPLSARGAMIEQAWLISIGDTVARVEEVR